MQKLSILAASEHARANPATLSNPERRKNISSDNQKRLFKSRQDERGLCFGKATDYLRDRDRELAWTRWGQLQVENASRAVVITISGPGMKLWCMSLPFEIHDAEVALGKPTEFETAKVGLLPNWP